MKTSGGWWRHAEGISSFKEAVRDDHAQGQRPRVDVLVSWNMGTPQSSIYRWIFHEIDHLFWGTPIYGNAHMLGTLFPNQRLENYTLAEQVGVSLLISGLNKHIVTCYLLQEIRRDWGTQATNNRWHRVTERCIVEKLCHLVCQVVMLVLVIMLSLPFFQPGMYNDDLSSSAQYGINVLYRRWRDDMSLYEPYANATAEAAYLSSKGREVYVDDFFLYAYYHSPFTQEDRERSSCQVVHLSFQLRLHHILCHRPHPIPHATSWITAVDCIACRDFCGFPELGVVAAEPPPTRPLPTTRTKWRRHG